MDIIDPYIFPPPQPPWTCRWLAHNWGHPMLRDTRPRMYMRRCRRCGWVQYGKAEYDFREATYRWEKQIYRHDDWGPWPAVDSHA